MTWFNKNKFFNYLLFAAGFAVSYILPQTVELMINKVAQYTVGIIILLFAFFFFSRSNERSKCFLGGILSAISFQVVSSASYYITKFTGKEILIGILALFTVVSFVYWKKVKHLSFKYLLTGILLSVTFISFNLNYGTALNRINTPYEWDFLCYYLNGRVAVQGLNYYDPENYIKVFNEIEIPIVTDEEFYRETVEVAIQYFPQSIFLFLPLGLFDCMTANYFWNVALYLFLVLDVFLIYKIFFKKTGIKALLLIIPLFFLFRAVWYSIVFESYTFLMLFILLLIWQEKNENRLGLWISIGIALKPLMLIFVLYPVLRKKWKAFFYSIVYSVILLLITAVFFGPSTVLSFFTNNTVQNLPFWSYTDNVNQSLLPTILRITNYDFALPNPIFHPLFLGLGFLISAISFWIIYKTDKSNNDLALSILVLYALIIYPSTLNHYFLLAVPVILYFIKLIDESNNMLVVISLIIGLSYYLMSPVPFLTILILWLFIVYYYFQYIFNIHFFKNGLANKYAGKTAF